MKIKLLGKTPDELRTIAVDLGLPKYAANQMATWLYKKDVSDIGQMSDLSKKSREILGSEYEIGARPFSKVMESADGTKKYLFPAGHEKHIEAAYIPEYKRHTLCLSTQVGCRMACMFCMTGTQGFQGNLTAGEIINQLRSLPERDRITNIVYMGMGEPFDNMREVMKSLEILTADYAFGMSPRRITVSTIGMIPEMREFLSNSDCHLAISLHTPFENERRKLMPVEKAYPLSRVIDELKQFEIGRQRRISFEYILLKDINHSNRHINEMARLLNGLRCRINLIRFHPVPGVPLETPDEKTIMNFKDALNKKGLFTTVRQSRGEDIHAACGMLSTKTI